MTDKKISALTTATTPLAGTEVLPIVQAGATVKVAVSDLTAGRAISATSINKMVVTSPATISTLTIADGKTLTTNNSLIFAGTDATTMTFPATSASIARTDAAQSFTGNQTLSTGNLVIGTFGKGIDFSANTPAAGMTSQLLNWYEAGTWTPGQGANLTVVGAFSSAGKYTRIGRQVTVYGSLTGATSVAITGGISELFTGLPFAPADGTSFVITNAGYSAGGFGRTAGSAGYCITTFAATGTLYFTITYQMA